MPQQKKQVPLTTEASDPLGEFLSQAYLEGRVPGDPISAFNTVLDLLGPSAVQDRAEAGAVPATTMFQDMLGLSQEETDELIRQQVGLQISPSEELTAATESRKILGDLVKPLIEQQTEREKRVSVEKVEKGKLDVGKQRVQAYKERTAELNALDPSEAFKFGLQRAFIDGGVYDKQGNFTPIEENQKQRIGQVLEILDTNPQVGAGVMRLLDSEHLDMPTKQKILSDALGVDLEVMGYSDLWGEDEPIFGIGGGEQVSPEIPENLTTDDAAMLIMQEILKELQ